MTAKREEYGNENTVVCLFFSSIQNKDISYWETLCKNVNEAIISMAKDFIWHRDELHVYLNLTQESTDNQPHLISITCFGDNIEDEWFIVYLLLEITKQYGEIVVKIKDSDGDFLLIEAADFLPSWARPENTDNRVFIQGGHIHLISPEMCKKAKLEDSINLVCDKSIETEDSQIEQAVLNRILSYPGNVKENMHRAIVKLPLDIAALLMLKPRLISPIVNSYCHHDMIDARALKNVKLENVVTIPVVFTKCLYAMLIHSRPIKNIWFPDSKDKSSCLGLKLTCGYKIIMSQSSENIFATKEYKRFLKKLEQIGYFKENLKGSQNYNKLLENANEFFMGIECSYNAYARNLMLELKTTDTFNELKQKLQNTNDEVNNLEIDNDDWLSIDPEQLNQLLSNRYGKSSGLEKGDIITPQRITAELSSFLNKDSDIEGIETNKILEKNSIEFDENEFVESLNNMMNFITSNENDIDNMQSDTDDNESMLSDDGLDKELKEKLSSDSFAEGHCQNVVSNLIQSIKEEGGSCGPSSNILKSIGVNKVDIVDYDDDLNII